MAARVALRIWLAALTTAPAAAQYLNRAAWLGIEEEGIRRDFSQGSEYFLDRFSYVSLPPWMERGLPRFADGIDYRMGSVTTSDFTIEGSIDKTLALGDGFGFGYHVLQSETRDARFLRNAIEFDYALGDETAVFVQTEMFADKDLIDVSAGAWLLRREQQALRAMVTAVDAPSEKSDSVDYLQRPVALMLAGVFGDPERQRLAFELAGQLPFDVRDVATGDEFSLQRWIGSCTWHLRVADRDWIVAGAEVEWTEKQLDPATVGDPRTEDFDRDFGQVRLEWWRDEERTPWSIGVLHTWQREDGRRPFDPASSPFVRRSELFALARMHLPVGERLSFEPQLLAGHVDLRVRDGGPGLDVDRFEGKLSWYTRYDFSPRVSFTVGVSAQLDRAAFGGGGAWFVARF